MVIGVEVTDSFVEVGVDFASEFVVGIFCFGQRTKEISNKEVSVIIGVM
jgi:hypothetical protein